MDFYLPSLKLILEKSLSVYKSIKQITGLGYHKIELDLVRSQACPATETTEAKVWELPQSVVMPLTTTAKQHLM